MVGPPSVDPLRRYADGPRGRPGRIVADRVRGERVELLDVGSPDRVPAAVEAVPDDRGKDGGRGPDRPDGTPERRPVLIASGEGAGHRERRGHVAPDGLEAGSAVDLMESPVELGLGLNVQRQEPRPDTLPELLERHRHAPVGRAWTSCLPVLAPARRTARPTDPEAVRRVASTVAVPRLSSDQTQRRLDDAAHGGASTNSTSTPWKAEGCAKPTRRPRAPVRPTRSMTASPCSWSPVSVRSTLSTWKAM